MTEPQRVVVTQRIAGPIHGYTTVHAQIDGGVAGQHIIPDGIVGTLEELDEIRAQSAKRAEAKEATAAGQS
jgi:hypothetical protein